MESARITHRHRRFRRLAESRVYTNVRNLVTAVYTFDGYSNQQAWTSYLYDPLDQLIQVDDEHRDLTRSSYGALGRLTSLSSPAAGTTQRA